MACGYSNGILPSNIIAKQFIADIQSLIGIFHCALKLHNPRYSSLIPISSVKRWSMIGGGRSL